MSIGFLVEAPLRQARRISDAELAGKATPSQVRWLHARPVLWLRALIQAELDVNAHIERSQGDLTNLKPPGGVAPSLEYLAAKAERDRRHAPRLHFKRLLERRKAEVVTLLGTRRPVITGDLVDAVLRIAAFIDDDDVQSARDYALYLATRWKEQLGGPS